MAPRIQEKLLPWLAKLIKYLPHQQLKVSDNRTADIYNAAPAQLSGNRSSKLHQQEIPKNIKSQPPKTQNPWHF